MWQCHASRAECAGYVAVPRFSRKARVVPSHDGNDMAMPSRKVVDDTDIVQPCIHKPRPRFLKARLVKLARKQPAFAHER